MSAPAQLAPAALPPGVLYYVVARDVGVRQYSTGNGGQVTVDRQDAFRFRRLIESVTDGNWTALEHARHHAKACKKMVGGRWKVIRVVPASPRQSGGDRPNEEKSNA